MSKNFEMPTPSRPIPEKPLPFSPNQPPATPRYERAITHLMRFFNGFMVATGVCIAVYAIAALNWRMGRYDCSREILALGIATLVIIMNLEQLFRGER